MVSRKDIFYFNPSFNIMQSNFPNLRRLFVEARTDAEESTYSRTAVSLRAKPPDLELRLICHSSTTLCCSYHRSLSSVLLLSALEAGKLRFSDDCLTMSHGPVGHRHLSL